MINALHTNNLVNKITVSSSEPIYSNTILNLINDDLIQSRIMIFNFKNNT